MDTVARFFSLAAEYAWGTPLILLLVGGGGYLMLFSRFIPFFGFRHAIDIIRGKLGSADDPGQISHWQALFTALSATVGVGNIGGVALAISQGGPGAVFWMWMSAIVGMATKFFTCTLACMYRKDDETGVPQGGPMYYIEVGLGPRWRPLAVLFAGCGLIGCLAMFQPNQLAEILQANHQIEPWMTGVGCALIVAIVIRGGLQRIAHFSEKLVPWMCLVYVLGSLLVVFNDYQQIPHIFLRIVREAFTGTAAAGGFTGIVVSRVIAIGVKRAAFSNEAGIGTAPMIHGAAKTCEPIREGLVAMLGPFIDTILVCSMTAFVILSSDVLQLGENGVEGVALTSRAFEAVLGKSGEFLVTASVTLFAITTMIGYSYYGRKCCTYLFGQQRGIYYNYFFVVSLVPGAIWPVSTILDILDTAFALMAIPNMIATLLLAPRVMTAARDYFVRHDLL